jgi:hypothetical protein
LRIRNLPRADETTIQPETTVSDDREVARVEASLGPLVTNKGGDLDMVSVEQHMRRLFADQGKNDMVLPICNKSMRKKLQALGALFGLNCTNKCSKLERYTTLTKVKKHSGKVIDEQQVAKMMEKFKRDNGGGGKGKGKGKSNGKSKEKGQSGHLKTKEGDVVGRVRSRCFTESNSSGFRLTNGVFLYRLLRRSARRTSGSYC